MNSSRLMKPYEVVKCAVAKRGGNIDNFGPEQRARAIAGVVAAVQVLVELGWLVARPGNWEKIDTDSS